MDIEDAIYIIKCDGKPVAWFIHESDRDICIDALVDEHEDCDWSAVQKGE